MENWSWSSSPQEGRFKGSCIADMMFPWAKARSKVHLPIHPWGSQGHKLVPHNQWVVITVSILDFYCFAWCKKSHKLGISPLCRGDTHHGSPSMTDMGMAPHTQQLDVFMEVSIGVCHEMKMLSCAETIVSLKKILASPWSSSWL